MFWKRRKQEEDPEVVKKVVTHDEFLRIQLEHIDRHREFLSKQRGEEVSLLEASKDWCFEGWADILRKNFTVVSNRKTHTISEAAG